MKKMFRKTYLEVILQRFVLENEEVWVKNGFGLKGVRESLSEGNENDLKTCHICLIKLKTRNFRGLEIREISHKTYWNFREKLLVAKQLRDSHDNLCMTLKNFQFCLKTFREKSLAA